MNKGLHSCSTAPCLALRAEQYAAVSFICHCIHILCPPVGGTISGEFRMEIPILKRLTCGTMTVMLTSMKLACFLSRPPPESGQSKELVVILLAGIPLEPFKACASTTEEFWWPALYYVQFGNHQHVELVSNAAAASELHLYQNDETRNSGRLVLFIGIILGVKFLDHIVNQAFS